ncbi:MAG: hypothetical protein WAR76_10510, partial [Xanthobacteraceae bacterium]
MNVYAAHAGRRDRYISLLHSLCELLLKFWQLVQLSTSLQAFYQSMQRPDVVGMLRASLNFAGQTKIVAIYFLGFGAVTPLRQKSSQSMPRWMHPRP